MIPNFESDGLSRLMADYYNLTGIKICVFDAEGKEIKYFPERYSPFCAALRENPAREQQCRLCDSRAIEACRKTGRSQIYTCHAGLTECFAPVLLNGEITGFIAIGQIREKESLPADGRGRDPGLEALYDALPVIGRDRIESALHVLEACAAYEQLKEYVLRSSEDFQTNLTQFVRVHIREDLGVDRLASQFRLSRAELYRRVEETIHQTPAEFVREQRLSLAAEFLAGTKAPVGKICAAVGIGDYNYFSKLFKRRYGLSPREYRRKPPESVGTSGLSVDFSPAE